MVVYVGANSQNGTETAMRTELKWSKNGPESH